MEVQLVIFKLGEEAFGVEIGMVESIIKMLPVTRLPQAPEFVEGVINLRNADVSDTRKSSSRVNGNGKNGKAILEHEKILARHLN